MIQSSLARPSPPSIRAGSVNPGRRVRPNSASSLGRCRAEAAPAAAASASAGKVGPYTGRDPEAKKPAWLRQRAAQGEKYMRLKESLGELQLNTVCVEAQCPNIGECWNGGGGAGGEGDGIATATIMLLGDTCTRGCRFCAVKTSSKPPPPDPLEPLKTSTAVVSWGMSWTDQSGSKTLRVMLQPKKQGRRRSKERRYRGNLTRTQARRRPVIPTSGPTHRDRTAGDGRAKAGRWPMRCDTGPEEGSRENGLSGD